MSMTREELELMWDLKQVIGQAPNFVLAFMGGEMSADAEIAFACQLVNVAEQLMHHANDKGRVVLNEDGTALEPAVTGIDANAWPSLAAEIEQHD